MASIRIKKNDTVVVISGKDREKKGRVLRVIPKDNRVIVEKVNMVAKHQKPKGQTTPGGILHQEAPIDVSNVMLVCDKCGQATRTAIQILENGQKIRVCKKCGDTFDK